MFLIEDIRVDININIVIESLNSNVAAAQWNHTNQFTHELYKQTAYFCSLTL